jgi:tetratricopeptide (TPR) repeat protein
MFSNKPRRFMTATEMAHRLLVILFLTCFAPCVHLNAQSDVLVDPSKTAQAKSEEEFDKYLEIVTAPDAPQVIDKANAFISQFPKSELLGAAYQYQMHAYQLLNNFDGLLASGRQALSKNPNEVNTLLTLASAMASRAAGRPDREELLAQAQTNARHALEGIETQRISRKVSLQEWTIQKHQMQADAHGALGTVALQRGNSQIAIHEFKTAIEIAPNPQGIQFLRLGLALASTPAKNEARENFRRAAELGPEPIRTSAAEELKKLSGKTSSQ